MKAFLKKTILDSLRAYGIGERMYQNISGDDVFEGLALAIARELEKEQIAKDVAMLMAVQVTQQMRVHLGGQTVYFPKSWAATKNARDQENFQGI